MKNITFLIGTGYNGCQLLSTLLSYGSNVSVFGEVGGGPSPQFYRDYYEGVLDRNTALEIWYNTRKARMRNCKEIYLERNHLIVPMLDIVDECFPNAKYIFLRRKYKVVVQTMVDENIYSSLDSGVDILGRLIPLEDELHYDSWTKITREKKIMWLTSTYNTCCYNFMLAKGPIFLTERWREIWYEQVVNPYQGSTIVEYLYNWIGIQGYNHKKLARIIKKQTREVQNEVSDIGSTPR
jgi:hypothetical protein